MVLERAIAFLTAASTTAPAPEEVVEELLQAEKEAKRVKTHAAYSQLLGKWRLGFITGTKRSRQQAGIVLRAGRFLPHWLKIHLAYDTAADSSQFPDRGTVRNSVELGLFHLVLSGPVQFRSQQNILAFDFTQMHLSLGSLMLYQGYIRNGKEREVQFWEQSLKQQAFFRYFSIQETYLAARGKGGGLALWTKA